MKSASFIDIKLGKKNWVKGLFKDDKLKSSKEKDKQSLSSKVRFLKNNIIFQVGFRMAGWMLKNEKGLPLEMRKRAELLHI